MQLKLFHIQNILLFYFLTLCTAPLLFENCYAHDLSLVRAAVSIPANGEMEISLVADIPSIATKLSGVDNPLELTSSQLSNSFSQLKRELAEETEIIVDSSRLDILRFFCRRSQSFAERCS